MLLEKYPPDTLCFLLNEVEGKDLDSQRELLTQWFVRNGGGNRSETEELLTREAEFAGALKNWRARQAKEWKAKIVERNSPPETPKPNTHDPGELRFGGSGTKGATSPDVTWVSQP